MGMMVVAELDEDTVGTAKVQEDEDSCDDVVHEGFTGGLYALGPGGDDEVPKDDEETAGERSREGVPDPS